MLNEIHTLSNEMLWILELILFFFVNFKNLQIPFYANHILEFVAKIVCRLLITFDIDENVLNDAISHRTFQTFSDEKWKTKKKKKSNSNERQTDTGAHSFFIYHLVIYSVLSMVLCK